MNFNPTILKSISSIFIGIVVGFFYSGKWVRLMCSLEYCPGYFQQLSIFPEIIVHLIIGFFVSFIITYLIWSLIQKKH